MSDSMTITMSISYC